jgi:hypothetical protein
MTDVPNMPPPPTVKINVEFEIGLHPKDCVLAVEHFVSMLCQKMKKDPAEATMMLLTAAVHLSLKHTKLSTHDHLQGMGTALGHAVGASLGWWPPKDMNQKKTILHS